MPKSCYFFIEENKVDWFRCESLFNLSVITAGDGAGLCGFHPCVVSTFFVVSALSNRTEAYLECVFLL